MVILRLVNSPHNGAFAIPRSEIQMVPQRENLDPSMSLKQLSYEIARNIARRLADEATDRVAKIKRYKLN